MSNIGIGEQTITSTYTSVYQLRYTVTELGISTVCRYGIQVIGSKLFTDLYMDTAFGLGDSGKYAVQVLTRFFDVWFSVT